MTQKELENISTEYGDKLLKERLEIEETDFIKKDRCKCLKSFNTYDMEIAFEDGVNYAISNLCNK